MATTPEGRVKDQVKKLLKKYKPDLYDHWPVQTGYGAACLDCHGCYKGRYFAVETKAPGKKPTKRQDITMREIHEAGGVVFVVGEKLVWRKGDRVLGHPGEDYTTRQDIYSGMRELEAWLDDAYRL